MKAILITADGLEILTEVNYPNRTHQRAKISPSYEILSPETELISTHERTYERIDMLQGRTMEIAVYREKVEK